MRLIRIFSITTILVLGTFGSSYAEGNPVSDPSNKQERVIQLTKRVEEIRDMDFSELQKEERKELRSEMKEIKRELRGIRLDDKLTISVGAAIIVLLLLIIIL